MQCPHKKNIILKIFDYIWSLFINGLIIILPITLTIVIFKAVIRLIISWLEPIRDMQPNFLKAIPYCEVIIVIVGVLVLGTILKIFILRKILHKIEDIIESIPFIKPVYSGIKQLANALKKDKLAFQKIVLFQFPRTGVYSIGFLTNEVPTQLAPETGRKFFYVFVPTTPNPTTGFLSVITEEEFTTLALTKQEAMALILSGGIITPQRMNR